MSIIPIPYIKQMRNNTFSIQFSDKFIVKSIAHVQDGKICIHGLELLVRFQIGLGFRVIGGFSC